MSSLVLRQKKPRSRILRRLRVLSRRHWLFRILIHFPVLVLRVALSPLLGIVLALVGLVFHMRLVAERGPVLLEDGVREQVVWAGLLMSGVALWTNWRVRQTYRHFFRVLGQQLVESRESPASQKPREISAAAPGEEASQLVRAAKQLAAYYRQALAQLVQLKTSIEAGSATGTPPGGISRHDSGSLFERSRPQMVARLTPNFRWQAATPLLQEVLGGSIERLAGQPFLDFVHPDDCGRVNQALVDTLTEGEGHNVVFRVLSLAPSGESRPEDSSGAECVSSQPPRFLQADLLAYYDAAGRAEQLRCHFIDVTERILAELALRKRTDELIHTNERLQRINSDLERLKESYRDLYHHAPVMYFSLDDRGRFAAVNETMLREMDYRREDLLGQPYETVLSPASRAARLNDSQVLQKTTEVETEWATRDGRVCDMWVGTSIIKDAHGKVVRARCAARDITERNQLAQAVVGRARDLERANGELRRINHELEEFTYVVSHDLKEPLRTLEAFSNFLSADYGSKLDDEGLEYIAHLTEASRRLGKLIDDLLTLSRAGRVTGTPQLLDWEAIMQTVLADLQLLVTHRPGCVIRIEKPLPVVQGDPERITQLLSNLVGNALKYNKNVQPEVFVGALPVRSGTNTVTLFVRDNGMGIDPRYHEQIFRIFRRLHRRDEYEGTGAGLAICKKVVEAHGGQLWVESEADRGSTFYFTLPRSSTRAPDPEHGPPGGSR